MSDKVETNFTFKGKLAYDPKAFHKKKDGGLIADFVVVVRGGTGFPDVFVPCVSFQTEVAEVILEQYRKGSYIEIVRSTPTVKDNREVGFKAGVKFIVWDVAEKTPYQAPDEYDGGGEDAPAFDDEDSEIPF